MRFSPSGWAVVLALAVAAPATAQQVRKVKSGDTIVVDGVGEVRLLGIDSLDESPLSVGNTRRAEPRHIPPPPPGSPGSAPPTPIFNGRVDLKPDRPSRDFLRKLVLGKTVRLQRDPLVADVEGQPPAVYLFLPDDTLVNLQMIAQGKARVDESISFAHEQEFIKAQHDAQVEGTGIWATEPAPKP